MADSLKTTVRNTHTSELFFSYLGSHGVTLQAGQEYTENGDLVSKITNSKRAHRWMESLNTSLSTGKLAIVSSPKDHFFDLGADETKVLVVNNGTVGVENPSWGDYSSSIS